VADHAEKPAIEEAKDGEPTVLIKIVTSSNGFPVELVYETPAAHIGALGRVTGQLPSPDMVVTQSQWDVYLPQGLQYGEPTSNMEQGVPAQAVSAQDMKSALASAHDNAALPALRIEVPTSGVRYSFNKIYANRSDEAAEFSVPYSSHGGAWLARLLALLGTSLFWLGLLWLQRPLPRQRALASTLSGAALVLAAIGWFGVSTAWPVIGSLLLVAGYGLRWLIANRPRAATA
jgi:hypothetical protein